MYFLYLLDTWDQFVWWVTVYFFHLFSTIPLPQHQALRSIILSLVAFHLRLVRGLIAGVVVPTQKSVSQTKVALLVFND